MTTPETPRTTDNDAAEPTTYAPPSAFGTYPSSGQPDPSAPYVQPEQRNPLAITALILSLLVWPVGLILGHVSLHQIKKRGETGRGAALAAVIIGWCAAAFTAMWIALIAVGLGLAASSQATAVNVSDSATQVSDCRTLDSEGKTLIDAINAQLPTFTQNPASAQTAIDSAIATFKTNTASLSDGILSSELRTLNGELGSISDNVAAFVASPSQDGVDSTNEAISSFTSEWNQNVVGLCTN